MRSQPHGNLLRASVLRYLSSTVRFTRFSGECRARRYSAK